MPNILTKTDISFESVTVKRVPQPDNSYKFFVDVGYRVDTQEGEMYNKDRQKEATGIKLALVKDLFDSEKADIKKDEGVN